jgi:hypothetical protein
MGLTAVIQYLAPLHQQAVAAVKDLQTAIYMSQQILEAAARVLLPLWRLVVLVYLDKVLLAVLVLIQVL